MEYISKTVKSRPGLSQEEALVTLQSHPQYKAGTIIKSIRQRGNRWEAALREPKTAEFPPGDDDDDEEETSEVKIEAPEESDDSDDDDGDSEGSPPEPESPFGDDKEDEPKLEAKGELGEVLQLLHSIVEKLGIGGPDEGLGLDEVPPLDVGAPPPHKGPGRPPGPGGAPPGPKPAGGGGTSQRPGLPVGANPLAGFASAIPSFTASSNEPMTIKEAKADLEKAYPGYTARQIKKDEEGTLHALMSNR